MDMFNLFAHKATDTEKIALSKKMILFVSVVCCLCGLLWSSLYYFYLGVGSIMLLPWIFVVGVGVSIPISHTLKNHHILIFTTIVGITAVPISIQWILGSTYNSGLLLLWSFLGPVGAILFLNKKQAIGWFVVYLVLILVSIIVEPQFSKDAILATKSFNVVFSCLNIITPTLVIFVAFLWYLSEKEKTEKALIEGKNQLEQKKEQVERQNLIIEESLQQKEVLLQEIHHRVKNNLQLVSGLMQLQGSQSKDAKIKAIMNEGQNRIRSMSLIHQQLYEGKNLDRIDFSKYIEALIQDISDMLQSESKSIDISLKTPDFFLDIDMGIPLGLILNELIVNAFKHAFTNRASGKILIEVSREGDDFEMRVSDNGRGLPENFDINTTHSLGISLVKGLSRQIGGSSTFVTSNGAVAIITFKRNEIIL